MIQLAGHSSSISPSEDRLRPNRSITMHAPLCQRLLAILVVITTARAGSAADGNSQPAATPDVGVYHAGSIYREFALHADGERWRVTDEDAVKKFPRAAAFLPNPLHELSDVGLEHAIAAEVLLDRWGGHVGTINKRIRFNENEWINVPEIQNTPEDIEPTQLMFQDNPVVAVPLKHLREGTNTIEADCDESGGFGWGQWGMYSLVLRVFYDPDKVAEQTDFRARIETPVSGDVLDDHPQVHVSARSEQGIVKVEVLASYDGFDEDGDGDFGGWHESRFQLRRGQPNDVRNHVGTKWAQPYRLTWDTHWVPDQAERSIRLIARVQDSRGFWYVTQPVESLTLHRDNVSVRLYRPQNVPEDFAVRVGQTKQCQFDLGDAPLDRAIEAALHLRTWHGQTSPHQPIRINAHSMAPDGKNHHYDYDLLPFPSSALRRGENVFSIRSDTEHHMLEVLWPGPAVVVRFDTSVE